MKKMILLCLMLFVIPAIGCTSNEDQSVKDARFFERVPSPESTEILSKLEIEEGMLYFYHDETGFRHSIVSHDGNLVVNSDAIELNPTAGVNWTINEVPDVRLIILAGVISHGAIQEISLTQNGIEHFGMIEETKNGQRLWYVLFDRVDDNGRISNEPFKLKGLSANGEVLWEDEVFIKHAYKWG